MRVFIIREHFTLSVIRERVRVEDTRLQRKYGTVVLLFSGVV